MGVDGWSLTAKPCDSCKTAAATVFCRADSFFLCITCDAKVHAPNKLSSRHARVWVCEVCEQAPATVTCKADAAALCSACDVDVHSANPLARRHERLSIEPFYDSVSAAKTSRFSPPSEVSEEEAEAASWLLSDPNNKLNEEPASPEYKSSAYLFSDMDPEPDPYLDLGLLSREQKAAGSEQKQYSSDGVVPVQTDNEYGQGQCPGPVVDGFPAYDVDNPGSKPFMYDFTSSSQPLSQSVSCSSLEVGVVPEMAEGVPVRVCGMEREARVLRYREKRKNRRFEKTIRYASRKAYAETRPRIKGRFARRSS